MTIQLQQNKAIAHLDNKLQRNLTGLIRQHNKAISKLAFNLAISSNQLVGTIENCSRRINATQNSLASMEQQANGFAAQLANTTALFNKHEKVVEQE